MGQAFVRQVLRAKTRLSSVRSVVHYALVDVGLQFYNNNRKYIHNKESFNLILIT